MKHKKGKYLFLQVLRNHAAKQMRLRKRFKLNKSRKNRQLIGHNTDERKEMKVMRSFDNYRKIKVPRIFSLTQDPENAIAFISKVEDALDNRQKVFINMRDVESITDGALVVLLSSMVKFKSNNVDFNGNFPSNKTTYEYLLHSGFFSQLYTKKTIRQQDSYSLTKSGLESGQRIFTHANKIVDTRLSANIISIVSSRIWGKVQRCLGLQRSYIELMQNTNNHASAKNKGVHHWWTTVSFDDNNSTACFAFIDYGIGIIDSIKYDQNSKFHNAIESLKKLLGFTSDADMLKKLLTGELHNATQEYYRGKGLPGIYNACKENKISNLVVITNGVMAKVSEDEYITLNSKFSGTFVYWELNKNNEHID